MEGVGCTLAPNSTPFSHQRGAQRCGWCCSALWSRYFLCFLSSVQLRFEGLRGECQFKRQDYRVEKKRALIKKNPQQHCWFFSHARALLQLVCQYNIWHQKAWFRINSTAEATFCPEHSWVVTWAVKDIQEATRCHSHSPQPSAQSSAIRSSGCLHSLLWTFKITASHTRHGSNKPGYNMKLADCSAR